eukprot:3469168-Pyramimonas_sp.AAC.1
MYLMFYNDDEGKRVYTLKVSAMEESRTVATPPLRLMLSLYDDMFQIDAFRPPIVVDSKFCHVSSKVLDEKTVSHERCEKQ